MQIDIEWLIAGMDRVWEPVASPLGLFLAILVTGHVLLNKRDIGASIGWIGLAWVAPTWGALIYYMLGINRVARRAQRVRGEPRSKARSNLPAGDIAGEWRALDRAVGHITKRAAESGNSVGILHHGDEAYPAMLAAIGSAQRSVALSSYIFRDDDAGERFVRALAEAHKRGVQVRVLVDGIGSGYFPPIYRRLRNLGLPVELFMHSALPWRMPFLNLRSHKKILVVDGRTAFTGGMNISAANLLQTAPPAPVADTHFRFEGPVAAQLMGAFARDWMLTAGEDLEGDDWFPPAVEQGSTVARVITSGPDQDLEKIQAVLLEAIACARTSIKLATPYFLPSEQIVTALALAAVRGVEVDIVLPARSDHRFIDLAMRAHVGPLLSQGVHIWLAPPPFNHTKAMIVDKTWCLVGSANWDMRSLRLNFELNVEVYSSALAAELDALISARQRVRLHLAHLDARTLPVRLRDAGLRLLQPYI